MKNELIEVSLYSLKTGKVFMYGDVSFKVVRYTEIEGEHYTICLIYETNKHVLILSAAMVEVQKEIELQELPADTEFWIGAISFFTLKEDVTLKSGLRPCLLEGNEDDSPLVYLPDNTKVTLD